MQMSSLLKSNAKEFHSRRCRCRAIENERSVARCRRNVCGNRFDGGGWRASIVLIWLDGVPSGVVMDGSGRRWRDGSHTHTHTRQSNRLSTLRGNGDAGQYFVAGQQSTTRNRILPFGCRSARDVLRHRLASIFPVILRWWRPDMIWTSNTYNQPRTLTSNKAIYFNTCIHRNRHIPLYGGYTS